MSELAVAGIQAAGSLLGGLFGKDPPKPSAMVVSHIKGVMDASKRFGMNPLTILQSLGGPTQGAAPPNYMGQAISDAAAFAADAFLKQGNQQALQMQAYAAENQRLNKRLVDMTLRPIEPGIYQRGGNGSAAGGVVDIGDPSGDLGGGGSLGDVLGPDQYNWLDPDIRSESDDASRVPEKSLWIAGQEVKPQSGTSDAEAIGSRYGEDFLSPAWFAGWRAFAGDALAHRRDQWVRFGAHIGKSFSRDLAKTRAAFEARNGHGFQRPAYPGWMNFELGSRY